MVGQSLERGEYAFTCWHIWKARCKFVYNDIPIVHVATRSRACLAVSEFWNVTEKPVLGSGGMPIQISSPHHSHWLPPISSYVKINTDGSWKFGSAMAGVGVIIRKIVGSCIGGLAAQVRAQSPLMAKVLALKHGPTEGSLSPIHFSKSKPSFFVSAPPLPPLLFGTNVLAIPMQMFFITFSHPTSFMFTANSPIFHSAQISL
ncbi:hypothetical protein Pyn_11306 [Prunus yedoensis var. nudiflora]|uniref:RNase H type-1 domain-containing protein n=1 Tax=Prunus yedoensis var. nudiflora TaxID=2094558 RepID=A0A314UEJ0_PRUYE|nr:hypothetical protein Pyn_11306 [Prunus yedoensis var. nudiflora]